MKFNKPPVVEVWISIDFDPNENKRQFDVERVQQYVQQYESELPKLEVIHEETIQVQESSSTDLPQVVHKDVQLKSVRLWDKQRSRMLQIGDDQIAFHLLKTNEETPGYQNVRQWAEPKLADYVKVFQPSQIRHATLHYLDIINIPKLQDGILNLSDYFPFVTEVPDDPFGPTAALTQQFQVMCPVDEGPLFFRLQSLPSSPEMQVFRFRLEWHKLSAEITTLDLAEVWKRMDVAHDYMWKCFTTALSGSTIQLFDPIDETEES